MRTGESTRAGAHGRRCVAAQLVQCVRTPCEVRGAGAVRGRTLTAGVGRCEMCVGAPVSKDNELSSLIREWWLIIFETGVPTLSSQLGQAAMCKLGVKAIQYGKSRQKPCKPNGSVSLSTALTRGGGPVSGAGLTPPFPPALHRRYPLDRSPEIARPRHRNARVQERSAHAVDGGSRERDGRTRRRAGEPGHSNSAQVAETHVYCGG